MEIDTKVTNDLVKSVIGLTESDEWGDVLQEKISLQSFFPVQVTGISHRKFLITFSMVEDIEEQQLKMLKQWFYEIKPATHL